MPIPMHVTRKYKHGTFRYYRPVWFATYHQAQLSKSVVPRVPFWVSASLKSLYYGGGMFFRLFGRVQWVRRLSIPLELDKDCEKFEQFFKREFGDLRAYFFSGWVNLFKILITLDNAYTQRYMKWRRIVVGRE